MVTASNGHKETLKLPELPSADSTRRGAQRAYSVTPTPASTAPRNSPSPLAGARLNRWLTGSLSGSNLLDAHHPSLRGAWSGHREAAGRWDNLKYVKHARHAWGLLHLLILSALGVAGWVTQTFLRTLVAVALIYALTKWS